MWMLNRSSCVGPWRWSQQLNSTPHRLHFPFEWSTPSHTCIYHGIIVKPWPYCTQHSRRCLQKMYQIGKVPNPVQICICTRAMRMHATIHTYLRIDRHRHTYTHTHILTQTQTRTRIHILTHTHIHTYTHTHLHTYTHTYAPVDCAIPASFSSTRMPPIASA